MSFLCSLKQNVKISANGAVKWDEKIVHLCEKHGLLSDNSVRVVGKAAYCFITQIPYRMVKCQAISHPVRDLNAGDITGASDQCTSICAEDVCCG